MASKNKSIKIVLQGRENKKKGFCAITVAKFSSMGDNSIVIVICYSTVRYRYASIFFRKYPDNPREGI